MPSSRLAFLFFFVFFFAFFLISVYSPKLRRDKHLHAILVMPHHFFLGEII